MTLREFCKQFDINQAKLSRITGVPVLTIKRNMDKGFNPVHQKQIMKGLQRYFSQGLEKIIDLDLD